MARTTLIRAGIALVLLIGWRPGAGLCGPGKLEPTPAEHNWLAAHPQIRLAIDPDYPPYSFIDESGKLQGVVPEFLAKIENMLGIRFQKVVDLDWPALLEAARNHQVDAVATVVRLPDREAFLDFTEIYLPTPLVIMTRLETPPLPGPHALEELQVALVKDYSSSRQALERYPGIQPVWVDNPLAGLMAVAAGQADAYVGVLGVNTWLALKHGISNLKVNAAFDMTANGQRFGIRKDWPILTQLMDKALKAIPEVEKAEIFRHWLPLSAESIPVLGTGLTLAEQTWLQKQSPLRVGITQGARPFAFVDSLGNPAGIAVDVLRWIQDRTGVALDFRPGLHRQDLLESLRQGELDVAAVATAGDHPLPGVLLTPAFQRTSLMIFGTRPNHFTGAEIELYDQPVAVCRHGPAYDYLSQRATFRLLPVDSPREALQVLAQGKARAAVMEGTLGLRVMEESGLDEVLPQANLEGGYLTIRLAVRSDRPHLASLLSRLIHAIAPQERAAILARWLGLPPSGFARKAVVRWVLAVAVIAVALVSLILLWNRLLQKELARRQRKERQLLAEVSQQKALFESIFRSIPDLVFRLDQAGTILDFHADDHSELYIAPKSFLGQRMQDVLPANLTASLEEKLALLRRTGGPVTLEYQLEVPKGKRAFEAKINSLADSDQVIMLVRDITDRKLAEESLRQARQQLERRVAERTAELAAANHELESFCYAVSHDLRTPLRAITGFQQALQEDYQADLPAGAVEYLDEIARGAHRMSELIDGLLTLSRTSRSELTRQRIQLDVVAREILERLSQTEPNRQVSLEIQSPLIAEADLRLTRTLLQNLLENAWKYTAKTAQARIAFYTVTQDAETVFCIEDNGAGFDMAFVSKLFEPFQRLHTQKEFPGIGIGLATVWRIVRRHGGWIRGEGEVDKGARFYFTLSPAISGGAHENSNPVAGGG